MKLEALKLCINNYNATINEHNELKKQLLSLNYQVARKHLSIHILAYIKAMDDKESNQNRLLALEGSKQQKQQEIQLPEWCFVRECYSEDLQELIGGAFQLYVMLDNCLSTRHSISLRSTDF